MEIVALLVIGAAAILAGIWAFRARPVHYGWVAVMLIAVALLLWFALGVGPVADDT